MCWADNYVGLIIQRRLAARQPPATHFGTDLSAWMFGIDMDVALSGPSVDEGRRIRIYIFYTSPIVRATGHMEGEPKSAGQTLALFHGAHWSTSGSGFLTTSKPAERCKRKSCLRRALDLESCRFLAMRAKQK